MQFGRALERILYKVRHSNPHYGPVYIGKVDLADGFYRVWLSMGAIPKLAASRFAGLRRGRAYGGLATYATNGMDGQCALFLLAY